jgi:hypothetical protein
MMGRFYIIKDIKHICIGKEGPIRKLEDHKPLLFFPDELEKFQIALVQALKEREFSGTIDRKIGLLQIKKKDDSWEFTGNRGAYKATTTEVKELLTDLIRPGIKIIHKSKKFPGIVCSAPHGQFDLHSEDIAKYVARKIGVGCVVATHFRYPPEFEKPEIIPLYINVNRPTEGQYKNNILMKEIVTSRAGEVYYEYQTKLLKASGKKNLPLIMLIEIHAHNRSNHIEIATTGLIASEAVIVKQSAEKFLESLLHTNPIVEIKVEPLDDIYWKASMAKKFGAFRKEMVLKGLHIEFSYTFLQNHSLKKIKLKVAEWLNYTLSQLLEDEENE